MSVVVALIVVTAVLAATAVVVVSRIVGRLALLVFPNCRADCRVGVAASVVPFFLFGILKQLEYYGNRMNDTPGTPRHSEGYITIGMHIKIRTALKHEVFRIGSKTTCGTTKVKGPFQFSPPKMTI